MGRPNIICVTLDHLTFMHYKLTSGAVPLPGAYEKLAASGTEFTQARTSHPLCLPVRASMLTGVYAHKHGKINNGAGAVPCEYPLISEALGAAGYKLGYFGKNHSGFKLDGHFEGYYPRGYGNPYLTPEYKSYLSGQGLAAPIYKQEWGAGHYPNDRYDLTVSDNFNTYSAGVLEGDGRAHEACFLADMAEKWIEQNKSGPYFLRLDFWGPHQAFTVPESWLGALGGEVEPYPSFYDGAENRPAFVKAFADNIKRRRQGGESWDGFKLVMQRAYEHFSFIDAVAGKFIDKLGDDCAVIYTADHGDALGSHGGLVDKAGDLMEEVMRVPLAIRAPGYSGGHACDLLASNLDVPPTVLELAGLPVPDHMDGRSLVPLLGGGRADWREDFMAQHYGHFDVHAVQRAVYHGRYKYAAAAGYAHELYDLERDPFELDNLIGDSSHAGALAEMRQRLADNMRRFGDCEKI